MYLFNSDKGSCCGCTACVEVCSNSCITMEVDEEGFEYPILNSDCCIECGNCISVCPVVNQPGSYISDKLSKAYAVWTKNDAVRFASSSGGVFYELAKKVLNDGGAVFGAGFSKDYYKVQHTKVDCLEDLSKLQGSKYVQSSLVNVLPTVKELLDGERKVLFSGTPCQVEALHRYLKYPLPKLVTCDLVCFGVPSPTVFKRYILEQEKKYNSKTIFYSFRDKNSGWNFKEIHQTFENGKTYHVIDWVDPFSHGFLKGIFLRPACYRCVFYKLPRISDFTLGDYWGVKTKYPDLDDNKGTSLVLVHTEKGEKLLSDLKNILSIHPTDITHGVANNLPLNRPPEKPDRRFEFFGIFHRGSFNLAASVYFKKRDVIIRRLRRWIKFRIYRISNVLRR